MKQQIISFLLNSWLLNLLALALRIWRFIQPNLVKDSSCLLAPPTYPGSVGDEAMVVASTAYMRQKGIQYLGLVQYKNSPDLVWRNLETVDELVDLDNYFSYNDERSLKCLLNFIFTVSKYQQFYFLGADLLDGKYYVEGVKKRLRLILLLTHLGVQSTIVGFSFNKKPNPQCVAMLQSLPLSVRFCSRDAISRDRLVLSLNRPIELTADVAFLLKPINSTKTVQEILSWIEKQRQEKRIVIGINIKDKKLQSIYINSIKQLWVQNDRYSFFFLPHHFYIFNGSNDYILADVILQELPDEIKSRCLILPQICSASEVKAIVYHLDIVLSNRMHVAIASLGQTTPVGCITYQDKFEGLLFKHFELEKTTIAPEEVLEKGDFIDFLLTLIKKRDTMRKKIKAKLPEIQELATKNFSF